jgi:hypothetical protein
VHYIKEDFTTWLFFVAGFQRKKERKWVFFGADMPIAFES